jgi:ferredoxin--NADP+ reductase
LSQSRVKEVCILGRRGPAQAAFTNPEIKELGELSDANITALPEEVELDPLSQKMLERSQDRGTMKKIEILQGYTVRKPSNRSRQLIVRFLVSPVELIGNEAGQVAAMRLVKNELYSTEAGTLRPRPTDRIEKLLVGLVFRSVGYRGVPLPGVPFNEKWGVILNQKGRVLIPDTQEPVAGEYTAGWVKRGPSGIIGTNKPDALETVTCMLKDLSKGLTLTPSHPEVATAKALIRQRQPNYFSYEDWLRLDEIEVARGQEMGRPRVKFTRIEDMLAALGR